MASFDFAKMRPKRARYQLDAALRAYAFGLIDKHQAVGAAVDLDRALSHGQAALLVV